MEGFGYNLLQMKKYRVHFGFILIALFCFYSCSFRPMVVPPWPKWQSAGQMDPYTLVSALNKRYPTIESFKSRIQIQVEGLDPSPPTLNGEIILQKPHSVRLRTYTPTGGIAFDLLYKERELEFYLPHRRELVIIPLNEMHSLELGGSPFTLPHPEEWWRLLEPWEKLPLAENPNFILEPSKEQGRVIFKENLEGGLQYLLDWKTGRIETLSVNQQFLIRYQNWRPLKSHEMATEILWKPIRSDDPFQENKLQIKFHLSKIKENLQIPEKAFRSIDHEGAKVTRLGENQGLKEGMALP